MKHKKNAKYVNGTFVMINKKKGNLKYTKKLEIVAIIQDTLDERLIAIAI